MPALAPPAATERTTRPSWVVATRSTWSNTAHQVALAAAARAYRKSAVLAPAHQSVVIRNGFQSNTWDQVIRENPASRGTETSAEVLVGPPWRMESNAGQQQWY